jgi:hypothetical protein
MSDKGGWFVFHGPRIQDVFGHELPSSERFIKMIISKRKSLHEGRPEVCFSMSSATAPDSLAVLFGGAATIGGSARP